MKAVVDNNCPDWQGLGAKDFRLGVLIGNRPDAEGYQNLEDLRPLANGEIAQIVTATGNHWRKIFNIAAKLGYGLWPGEYQSWQQYRDERLLQAGSEMAILFSPPQPPVDNQWLLITGKQYRMACFPKAVFFTVEGGFEQHPELPLLQTPYFDYRQLPNAQLDWLVDWLSERVIPSQ